MAQIEEEEFCYEAAASYADPTFSFQIIHLPAVERPVLKPSVNMQLDEPTLRCVKWLLIDQKNVDLEMKTAPLVENIEYGSSDEDIWESLTDNHAKSKEVVQIKMACEWQRCNAQFDCELAYRDHIGQHFKELARERYQEYHCEWDLCGYKTDCIEMFERHVLHHEIHGRFLAMGESKEIMNRVPKCNLAVLYRNRLPDLLTDFYCYWKDCSQSFRALSVLHDHVKYHIKSYVLMGNKLECHWRGCSYIPQKLHLLEKHVSCSHLNIRQYSCRKCGATRKYGNNFLAHFLSQAPVKNPDLCCQHCGQLFLKVTNLRTHLKHKHKEFICNYCHVKFSGRSHLKTHISYVHIKLRPFKCTHNQCEKAFYSKKDLKLHMYVHEKKEGGYQCENCDAKYEAYSSLRNHNYMMHTGRNYPYECHLCGKQYKQSYFLGAHFKTKHGLSVPEGFHRFTYRLEENLVFRLKTFKTFEPNSKGLDKPMLPKLKLPPLQPVTLNMKTVEVRKDFVKVDLEAIELLPDEEKVSPTKKNQQMITRAAKKLLDAGKPLETEENN